LVSAKLLDRHLLDVICAEECLLKRNDIGVDEIFAGRGGIGTKDEDHGVVVNKSVGWLREGDGVVDILDPVRRAVERNDVDLAARLARLVVREIAQCLVQEVCGMRFGTPRSAVQSGGFRGGLGRPSAEVVSDGAKLSEV
jgi:hypothetical protein